MNVTPTPDNIVYLPIRYQGRTGIKDTIHPQRIMITESGSLNGILDIRVIVKALSMVINNSINTEHDENHIKTVPYTIHNPSPNIHVPVTVAMKVKGRHETVNNISLIDNDAMKALVTELKRR